jgi:outer membrane lipoprotein LolB
MMRTGLTALLFLLLAACASHPPRPSSSQTMPGYWEAEGRAAVRAGEKGGSLYFTWTQTGDAYHIIVRGPLGLGRAELFGVPGLVTFSNGQQEVSASSPEELLEKMAHREAPVSHAVHWLKAEPATAAALVTRGPDGKVREIKEDGWTVDYVDWSQEAPDLPHKFTLRGPDAQATVIVGLWRLAPPPPLATAP